jgi:hypothetical protein
LTRPFLFVMMVRAPLKLVDNGMIVHVEDSDAQQR